MRDQWRIKFLRRSGTWGRDNPSRRMRAWRWANFSRGARKAFTPHDQIIVLILSTTSKFSKHIHICKMSKTNQTFGKHLSIRKAIWVLWKIYPQENPPGERWKYEMNAQGRLHHPPPLLPRRLHYLALRVGRQEEGDDPRVQVKEKQDRYGASSVV